LLRRVVGKFPGHLLNAPPTEEEHIISLKVNESYSWLRLTVCVCARLKRKGTVGLINYE
jgi:hypothetical protein